MSDVRDLLRPGERERASRARLPSWTEPTLATLTEDRFSDDGWIFERKLDGERALTFADGSGVRLLSRNRKDLGGTYPEVVDAMAAQPVTGCVVDGEVVAFEGALTSFARLQGRMQTSDPEQARRSGVAVFYYVFDLLHLDGWDLTGLPLRDRKRLLRRAVTFGDPLRLTSHRNGAGEAYWREACRKGLGALLVGYYDQGDLVYAGKVGTGFDARALDRLGARMGALERPRSPFARGDTGPARGVHWVSPDLVCEAGFTAWTDDGQLRHPRYTGLRRDKDPREVHREVPA